MKLPQVVGGGEGSSSSCPSCAGPYELEEGRVLPFAPVRPVYWNRESGNRIFFNRKGGKGWCFGKAKQVKKAKEIVCSKSEFVSCNT